MDDFNVSALHESKNEWGSRLITLLTPLVIDGYKSILDESIKLCKDNKEQDKYLMTFQNLISRIPKWNTQIIENERIRICEKSGCNYLEDLVTCVHIIQLKVLTAMRVGQKQKKVDISVPKLDDFIHKVYINVARKVYKNVYLFEVGIQPLQIQKNHRELEIIVQEGILNTLRESIPVEAILKAYMDESVEEDVIEEVKEEVTHEPIHSEENVNTNNPAISGGSVPSSSAISFNDIDYVQTENGVSQVLARKDVDTLEAISEMKHQQRKLEEGNDDDDGENIKLNISDQSFSLDNLDVHPIEEPNLNLAQFPELDVEVLD
jgi:hypothetical protein